jgi:geranylgeranyl pyrophosphate synthase
VLPALAGGASDGALERLEELAYAWGLAYQILDDFKDGLMSRRETGKSTARDGALGRPNLPAAIGRRAAMARLEELSAGARTALDRLATLGFSTGRLERLQAFLDAERRRIAERLRLG